MVRRFCLVAVVAAFSTTIAAVAEPGADTSASERAENALVRMTQAEKLALVRGVLGAPWGGRPKPTGAVGSAGYVPGIPRLGIPALEETDAELGVANPGHIRRGDTATAMPSDLALASTWDLAIARRQGEAVGTEARAKGFNVLLGGAANLIRDPRGGRNFEYFSEDPLLTGLMAGAVIEGSQSRGLISTIKHFALNAQETDRVVLDARIDPSAARESDLLAFEIAIERGRPGSVMCAYNQINGAYSCENAWLLNEVLKGDWRYPGFVMSDWGAVHSTVRSALAGLDQESGEQLDTQHFFRDLGPAVADGEVPQARLDDMARRILRSIFANGLADESLAFYQADLNSSGETALAIERKGAVLLRNEGLLPLSPDVRRMLVVGAHADRGVPSGGGSSQVVPHGGIAWTEPRGRNRAIIFHPGSPLDALRGQFPTARVDYDDGCVPARAAAAARRADAVILFAYQWMTETADAANLNLSDRQDRLIETVAHANPHTVVVLETGGPVLMPWLDDVAAVLEAWYPGEQGAKAIAEILSGADNPSGRLPVTFPASETQLPHPKIQGDPRGVPTGPVGLGGREYGRIFTAAYSEGAAVGYKWFFQRNDKPLFPFGYGLSYTAFELGSLTASADGDKVTASVSVKNSGAKAGTATPETYVSGPEGANIALRLAGWGRVELAPGEERRVSVSVDPRLLATFDESRRRWRIPGGAYHMTAGFDAEHRDQAASFALEASDLPP
jgi:beta-glucosidase